MFDAKPETYVDFAAKYFEKTLDIGVVKKIYAHETLTPLLATELNPQASWECAANDAGEIHYPIRS